MPLASAFVIWLMGGLGTVALFRRARTYAARHRIASALVCVVIGILCTFLAISATSGRQALAETPIGNQPIGQGKGIFPGRVVWVHDPNATRWLGRSYPWQPRNTSQDHVDAMVAQAICQLTGQSDQARAWDAAFKHFNQQHGKGLVGYRPGEKIAIKVNMSTCNVTNKGVNPLSYDKRRYLDRSDTSPQLITAVLGQLVEEAGVDPNHIAVGDTLCLFPNQWWYHCHRLFPQVTYFDAGGQRGRVESPPSDIIQYWSLDPINEGHRPDHIPQVFAEAAYIINMAVLKGHIAGVSLCAKNHYGSYNRKPDNKAFFDLHPSLACYDEESGRYRALVDIMGHPHMGGKTLLYVIDGLYGGYRWDAKPFRFKMAPFNNHWPASVFVSLDPVAIDSVALDILWQEWPHIVRIPGVDDYLHEAALANDPPSGMLYDPDMDGKPLESLGVHEHWNNPQDRQYSRNLGKDKGIELVYVKGKALDK